MFEDAKNLTDFIASVTDTLVFDTLILRIMWRAACNKVDNAITQSRQGKRLIGSDDWPSQATLVDEEDDLRNTETDFEE
jgi:hypothetical protein